jgi:hypothetical protein
MRIQRIAGLLFAGAVAIAGCAANTDVEEDTQTGVAEEAYHTSALGKKLVGDYVAENGTLPTLRLDGDQSYAWDTGIRCVRAPCPSGEGGKWNLYKAYNANRYYVGLFSTEGNERWFRVRLTNGEVRELDGVWGEKQDFVPARKTDPCAVVRCGYGTTCQVIDGRAQCVEPASCAAMLCGPGTYCVEENGQGRCEPYPTCATTSLLCVDPGKKCVDTPIVCVRAPCPPTAPSCGYVCPADGTINCMPIVPASRAHLCSGEYHQWIGQSCPNVELVY